MKIFITVCLLLSAMFIVSPVSSAGFCTDLPGRCLSSPFCLGKKVGATCRSVGTCKSITSQQLKTCCSCVGGKSPNNALDLKVPYNPYPFPDFNHRGGDLPMGRKVERY